MICRLVSVELDNCVDCINKYINLILNELLMKYL